MKTIRPAIPLELASTSQEDSKVVENNQLVKDDSNGLAPSRGCPIRPLALQQDTKFSLVMLTLEYEDDFHQKEKNDLAQDKGV